MLSLIILSPSFAYRTPDKSYLMRLGPQVREHEYLLDVLLLNRAKSILCNRRTTIIVITMVYMHTKWYTYVYFYLDALLSL